MDNNILSKVKEFIGKTFRQKGSQESYYHNLTHTAEVVQTAEKMADAMGISDEEKEILLVASWFHDIGHIKTCNGHEEISIEMAVKFLNEAGYTKEKINKVVSLINATRIPRNPKSLLEEIICDADLHHLGTNEFEKKTHLFKGEMEALNGHHIPETEWLINNLKFLEEHKFYTDYAKERFETQKNINYIKTKKKLKKIKMKQEEHTDSSGSESEDKKKKKDKEKDAGRSIETMFRNTIRTHVDFSSMADTKANILISVNTLVLTIMLSIMVRKLDSNPQLIIPSAILTLTSLVTLVYAILVTRPKVSAGMFTENDIKEKNVNLLFFGNFYKMGLKEFSWGMKEMMKDKDFLYENMIKDLYYLGQVLGQKYQKLRICYTFFMYGLIVSVLAFAIAFLMYPGTDLGPLFE